MVKLNDVGFDLMIDSRPVKFIESRAKFYGLIPEVLLLAGAYDKVTFFSILDRYFRVDSPEKREHIYEIILNISDNWAAKAPYEEGEIVLMDDFTDEPYISRTFPIDVKDRSKLKFTPIQKNWLSEWCHRKGELSKEEAKKVQKKTKRELNWEFGKKEMEKPEVKKAFELAEERGYMKKKDGGYEWCGQKSLLGFFLGLLVCEDSVIRNGNFQPSEIVKGKCFHSVYFQELFNDKNIGQYRRDLINKLGVVPENCGYEEIEEIVREAKATV